MSETTTKFVVHCPECQHSWVAAYLPMNIETFAKVASAARCPKGCDARPLCGLPPKPFLPPSGAPLAPAQPATVSGGDAAHGGGAR